MNSSTKTYSKLKWTPQEQELLRSLKQERRIDSWKIIANQMNRLFIQKNRSGKQCRERYMNYVRFGNQAPKTSGWTQQQDEELFIKFMEHGAKWVQIGKQMPGRSQNCLKNRFYGAMRKIIRKINRAAKQKKLRQKKPIKAELLIRILQYEPQIIEQASNQYNEPIQFYISLKKQMIKIAINPEQNSSSQQIQSLIAGITKFCSASKNSNLKKISNKQKQSQSIQSQLVESQQFGCDNSYVRKTQENEYQQARTPIENKGFEIKVQFKSKIRQNIILQSSGNLSQSKTLANVGFQLFQRNVEYDLQAVVRELKGQD